MEGQRDWGADAGCPAANPAFRQNALLGVVDSGGR